MNRKSNWCGDTGDYSPFVPPYLEHQIATSTGMNDDPKAGCIGMIIGLVLAILLLWLLPSCSSSRKALTTTSQSVTNSSAIFSRIDSTEARQHTQSEIQRVTAATDYVHDTVIVNNTTIVREADSMELARYGIARDSMHKAYLIQQRELRERISVTQKSLIDSLCMLRDSLLSLSSREYSLLALTKSCVEESASEETTEQKSPPRWLLAVGFTLVVILLAALLLLRK